MAGGHRVLYVAENAREAVVERLERAGYEVVAVEPPDALERREIDCVVTSNPPPEVDILTALRAFPDRPVVTYGPGPDGSELPETVTSVSALADLPAEVEAAISSQSGKDRAQERGREEALVALHEATRDLMAAESREEVLDVGIDAAESIVGLDIATFHVFEDGALKPVATTDATSEFIGTPPDLEPGSSIAWGVYRTGDPVVTDDVRDHPDVQNPDTPFRSEMVLPLGEYGIFIASAIEAGAFDEGDEYLARVLVSNVEAALDRADRESLLRERERALRTLHEATGDLMVADSREEVAGLVVETAERIFDPPLAGLWLYDEDENALLPVEYPDDLESDPPRYGPGEGLAWEAFETGEIRVDDDRIGGDGTYGQEVEIRSEIVVPIGDYGVLNAGSSVRVGFDETDRRLAGSLANTAAAAFQLVEREAERAAYRRELERQNERLEEFASYLSHDLRNPLNVATGHLELAREEGDLERLELVAEALDRMDELTADMLTLARQGAAVIDPEPVALADVAESAWGSVSESDADLELRSDPGTVRGDRSALVRLFENLLRNAVEHAGPDVTVEVGRLAEGFYVSDDGPGIPKDGREEALESGYTTSEEGTGFGLAIVAEIADVHGWEVTVTESREGGARFEFTGVDVDESPSDI